MRKIMILEEKDLKGIPGDMSALKTVGADWDGQADDVFLIKPYHTFQCLKSAGKYGGGSSVADFVKYILEDQGLC